MLSYYDNGLLKMKCLDLIVFLSKRMSTDQDANIEGREENNEENKPIVDLIHESQDEVPLHKTITAKAKDVVTSDNIETESSSSKNDSVHDASFTIVGGTSNNKLVVFNALGKIHNLALVENARRNVFKPNEWDCVAFMFAKEDRIPDDNPHLLNLKEELGCTIPRMPGTHWGDFLHYIIPTFVQNYEYLAIVLDDIFFSVQGEDAVNATKLIQNMQIHDIDVIQPGIVGDSHGYIQRSIDENLDQCVVEVNFIETYVQIFNSAAWECYYKMLHYTGSRGWCYDKCFKHKCPHLRLGHDFSMKAWHMGKKKLQLLPQDRLNGTDLDDYAHEAPIISEGYRDLEKFAICLRHKCRWLNWAQTHKQYLMKKITCKEADDKLNTEAT